jgi:hypothetical protein
MRNARLFILSSVQVDASLFGFIRGNGKTAYSVPP